VDCAGLAAALSDSLYLMKARARCREKCAQIRTDRPSCLLEHIIVVDGLYFLGCHLRSARIEDPFNRANHGHETSFVAFPQGRCCKIFSKRTVKIKSSNLR